MNSFIDMKETLDINKLKEAAQIMKSGGIVIFPTETVYGIGTNGLNEQAIKKLYDIKGRNINNPLNLLISSIEMAESITQDISPLEYKLMKNFFPGPLTIILKRKSIVPDIVTSGLDTVGIRMPNNRIAKLLVEFSNTPIAAPSANISGKPSSTNLDYILGDFSSKVDCIIDGGNSNIGIESTIIKVIDNIPHILRPGFITPEQIIKVAGNVILENEDYINKKISNLPSNNLKHYQLSSNSILVFNDDNNKMITKINEICKNYANPVIVCCNENAAYYHSKSLITYGAKNKLEEISKNIFSSLKKADSYLSDIIVIEGVKNEGIGIAIMDRLKNVCNNNFIKF